VTTKNCPRCDVPLHPGLTPTDTGQSQATLFCVRCRYCELGDVDEGVLVEWEADFYVHVEWEQAISMEQIRRLRLIDKDLGMLPPALLAQQLKRLKEIVLGPFSRRNEALDAAGRLTSVGLQATVTSKF
jgi:hypothetical protein